MEHCRLCTSDAKEGTPFCSACEIEVLAKNASRMKDNIRMEFSPKDRKEAVKHIAENRVFPIHCN